MGRPLRRDANSRAFPGGLQINEREQRKLRDRLSDDRNRLRPIFFVFLNDPRVYPVADMGVTSFSSLPSSMSSATPNS